MHGEELEIDLENAGFLSQSIGAIVTGPARGGGESGQLAFDQCSRWVDRFEGSLLYGRQEGFDQEDARATDNVRRSR